MYEQIENPKENKSNAVANTVAQKKSNVKHGFGFVDHRPKTISLRVQRKMPDNNSQLRQLRSISKNLTQYVESVGTGETTKMNRAKINSDTHR